MQKVIDADGHVMESDRELLEYLEPPFRGHPELLAAFMERQDVSAEAKGKILYDNPKRLYKPG